MYALFEYFLQQPVPFLIFVIYLDSNYTSVATVDVAKIINYLVPRHSCYHIIIAALAKLLS